MYTENFPHLLNLLEVSGQSGTLFCSPSASAEEASWQATCLLTKGKISGIKVCGTVDGRVLLEGRVAFEWLRAQGGLYWYLKNSFSGAFASSALLEEETITGDEPSAPRSNPILRRTLLGMRLGIQGVPSQVWSREHRTVFLLINGTRSRAEILRLLSACSQKNIDLILADLRSAGLIE